MMAQKKIKAGALQFVLFIGAIVAVLLLSFVLVSYSHNLFHKKTDITISLIQAADAGLELSFKEDLKPGQTSKISIINDLEIETKVSKRHWGILEIRNSTSEKGKLQFEKWAFVGHKNKASPALYLKDNQRPLVLAGSTKITGTSFLPERGVKMGNIYGNSYYASQLIYGKEKRSGTTLPKFSTEIDTQLKKLFLPNFEPEGEEVFLKKGEQLKNSFKAPVKIIKGDVVQLEKNTIAGNVIVWATQKIVVKASSKLNDIILVAPRIEIQHWAKGNFQAFAGKEIAVGKGCQLDYPTVLLVNDQKLGNLETKNTKPNILLDSYSQVRGAVIYLNGNESDWYRPNIHIDEHAKVHGEVYCAQNTELKGSVYGSLTTNAFVALENGSIYQNHLYNGTINNTLLPTEYAGILYRNNTPNQIMKWLY